jgi:hypothetical protein
VAVLRITEPISCQEATVPRPILLAFIALTAGVLSGCHGGDNDNAGSIPPAPSPIRGSLLQNPPALVRSVAVRDLLAAAPRLQALSGPPACEQIDLYSLQYHTVGGANEATTGSGALMVPRGSDSTCQGARPILLYAHGTVAARSFDITTLDDEGALIAALFAASGYIVVAPNYAGYATSTLDYHPYLNADQQSKDMIDALTAARSALPVASAPAAQDNGKLFITGYSEGGYVAMATHRALQATGATVTASAPLSGPYALAAFGDAIFQGQVSLGAPGLTVFISNSYLRAYGIYANPTELFELPFANGIERLLPSDGPVGDIPRALFSATPPADEFASFTPAITPSALAGVFNVGFGEPHLFTNAARLAYLRDAQMNPDGGFPVATDHLPPANATHALRAALALNDLRTWSPAAPLLLCGGNLDPIIFFMNTQLMQGYFDAVAPSAPVTVLDIDSPVGTDDRFAADKQGFAAAKAAAPNATAAVTQYHRTVAPFCLSAARRFFADH